jgi:hypothetical protein
MNIFAYAHNIARKFGLQINQEKNKYLIVLTYASETWTLTNSDRKQLNVFERKVYRRILGPVYDNEKEN